VAPLLFFGCSDLQVFPDVTLVSIGGQSSFDRG
jgi:hypothetical protein